MVKIISYSTCDLSQELIKKYDISILPLHILLGEEEFKDGFNITPDEIYTWADANKTTPKTSAAALSDAIDIMQPYADAGQDIVCFSISQTMSTNYNVLNLAANEFDNVNVYVIDSANLSTGIGLLVIEAAIMAKEGKSGKEIFDRIETLKPLVKASFVVDTLTYLHRGGRCSGVAAIAGSVMKLHPMIAVENGKMEATKKYRGKIEKVILDYVKDLEDKLKNAMPERVFITHSGCDDAIIDSVKEHLQSLNIFDEIHVTRAGGVVSSHCGPGTLGVLFISKN